MLQRGEPNEDAKCSSGSTRGWGREKMPCCGAPVQRHPVLFVTCSLSGLKDPQALLFVTTACTFSTPPSLWRAARSKWLWSNAKTRSLCYGNEDSEAARHVFVIVREFLLGRMSRRWGRGQRRCAPANPFGTNKGIFGSI